MAVNINGDTGIDKVQPGTIDSADFGPGSVTAPAIASGAVTSAKLDANLSIPGTMTATSFVGSGASLTGIAGGFSNMEVFTSPGTWTNPGNVQKVKVTVTGGGGGGAGGNPVYPQTEGGASGAAGGTAIEVIPFPSATNVPVTVGAGGAGTTENTPTAGSGATSSFGAYCSATGGAGGTGTDRGNNTATGGAGSGGTLNLNGGSGGVWRSAVSDGGASYFGGGGTRPYSYTNNPTNINGQAYGSGGAGTAGRPQTGGTGKDGVVIVEY